VNEPTRNTSCRPAVVTLDVPATAAKLIAGRMTKLYVPCNVVRNWLELVVVVPVVGEVVPVVGVVTPVLGVVVPVLGVVVPVLGVVVPVLGVVVPVVGVVVPVVGVVVCAQIG
jgi:hypothetical protein